MDNSKLESVKKVVRNIPDFPVKGIQFKDLTTAFKDPEALKIMADALEEQYRDLGVTKVVGIEARGFIGGSILASRLGAGFVPLRKPGKLPAITLKKTYSKEYGTDTIEIHRDAITSDDVVVLHDDLLATGGTML
ncbi:MAG: adenine phosphoribosyltransferase, partial [Muribaculaceae bacterium]|nr:adenine phosphoribosyltransferase [Muribaculaceae bacterium]